VKILYYMKVKEYIENPIKLLAHRSALEELLLDPWRISLIQALHQWRSSLPIGRYWIDVDE